MSLGLTIGNPKRRGAESFQSSWYRFYPCFSEGFAYSVLSSAGLRAGQWVLDPWNGSGTTSSRAISLGLNACGYDLNPVMVLVAKARSLDPAEYPSLRPLSEEIRRKAKKPFDVSPDDPLLTWLIPQSVAAIRSIEVAIQSLLVDGTRYLRLSQRKTDELSDLAAFFYVALFRMLRQILGPFLTSNPTWVKRPTSRLARVRPDAVSVRETFKSEFSKMLPNAPSKPIRTARTEKILRVASSESLPLQEASVDFVLGSPPYCTRIDYAVATSPELALLGLALETEFDQLRRGLIGTSTVPVESPMVSEELGETCLTFLEAVLVHNSKASATYYYKNHVQYFRSIATSISEINRVLKPGAQSVLVVQDSYYKDVHNNLPDMFVEMADLCGLQLTARRDFRHSRTLAGINPGANGYRETFNAVETVLVLTKTKS